MRNGFYRAAVAVAISFAAVAHAAPKGAADETPKSIKARAAKHRMRAALAKADDAWRQATIAAHKEYLKSLEEAMRTAGSGGDSADVALIAKEIAKAKEGLAALDSKKRPGAEPVAGKIYAQKEWQPVLKVKKGQVLKISADGEWVVGSGFTSGPDGERSRGQFEGRPYGMLAGRVGDQVFPIGASAEITIPADGLLEMTCTDTKTGRGDNDGFVEVTISPK